MTATELSDSDVNAIKQMMDEWTTALADRDWPKWQSHWTEDGTLLPPDNKRVVGRAKLADFAANNFGVVKSFAFTDWTFEGSADLAVVTNTIRVEFEPAGDEKISASNNQMLVLRKQAAGQWHVEKVIFNSDGS
ncbi:MAG: DUF4440 domain-containing protein [Pseudomonadota bacterium]